MFQIKRPENEPIRNYEPGSRAREELKAELDRLSRQKAEIPCWIDGEEVRTEDKGSVVMPHDHHHVLGDYYRAGPAEMSRAVQAALKAKPQWEAMSWQDRAAIFLKAADLI